MNETKVEVLDAIEPIDNGEIVIYAASIGLGLSVFVLSGAVVAGIVTGGVAALSGCFLLYNTRIYKPKIWNTMMEYPFATDVALSGIAIVGVAPIGFGGFVAGFVAAVFVSCGVKAARRWIGKVPEYGHYSLSNLFNRKPLTQEMSYACTL